MENYRIRKIDNQTWQFEDPFKTYMYLLTGAERAVLIDAGNGFSGLPEIVSEITDRPVDVLLTHGHFDHTGECDLFHTSYISQADKNVFEAGYDQKTRESELDYFSNLYQVNLDKSERRYCIKHKAPQSLVFLKEGEVIELGRHKLKVIYTPGHTKGSVCYLDLTYGRLFSGDTVCNREVLVYFEHSATVQDLYDTDEKLLKYSDMYKEIWPGHHECPLTTDCIEDYVTAAQIIMEKPEIGDCILLSHGSKILYQYKTIGISYTLENVFRKREKEEK